MSTLTIHDDIEPWLAASVHEQLSVEERAAFEAHLASCSSCRALHQEQTAMSKLIENTLADERPDFDFEQRVVSRFRNTAPQKSAFASLLANLLRTRATQLTAVAAVLLALVQIGRLVTDERPPAIYRQREALMTAELGKDEQRGQEPSPILRKATAAPNAGANARAQDKTTRAQSFAATGLAAPPPVSGKPAPQSAALPQQREAKLKSAAESVDVANAPAEATEAVEGSEPTDTTAMPDGSTGTGTAGGASRKLVRNAQVELEIVSFDDAVQKITAFAAEGRGYIATSSSDKQANGKLRGEVVVKVLPEKLDEFLLKLRVLGELKNQTLGTEDVSKQYFDTDSRLKNARVMEQRLIDILKTKSSKVADLLEVEKELGRVRAQIEEMQGALKYMDAQVQFATVTITLAEKDMNVPAAFLLKRTAQLALFSNDVEKTFAEAKAVVDGTKAQISSSTLDRDSSGEATARLVLLIAPEDADALIDRIKGMGRVQNYNEQTDRVAQGGSGMSENANVERDKVQLSITISRNEQEPALQTTSLRIATTAVTDKLARLKENAANSGAEIRSSSFMRNPDGQEIADITLRVAMKNYGALMRSFEQVGKVKDVSVQRQDRRGSINEETAPADITIQVYSEGRIVGDETGLFATIRRTLAQGATALMWSLRMIGVALAFLAPWALALAAIVWVLRRVSRRRAAVKDLKEQQEHEQRREED